MLHADLLIYGFHLAFWAAFGITRRRVRDAGEAADPSRANSATASPPQTAPFSRTVLGVHIVAFGTLYFGLGAAVVPNQVPAWFAGQRVLGSVLIVCGAALACWALTVFRSWRLRAQLAPGHELATGGPFRFVRHPIYAALNLLALGTAVWVPTPVVWLGFALMVLGGDLRGRREEFILHRVFGATYQAYCARTRRFLPGIY